MKIGIPKGSLFEPTINILEKIGIEVLAKGRSFEVKVKGTNLFDKALIIRPEDIPTAIIQKKICCGITGWDWVEENEMTTSVTKIAEFSYSKETNEPVKIVIFGKKGKGLVDDSPFTVSAEYPNLARRYFKVAKVVFSSGTTEAKVAAGIYNFGVGVTSTGKSLKDNDLEILKVIMTAPVVLIAENYSTKLKRFGEIINGVLTAKQYRLIKMNVDKANLAAVIKILPSLKSPTVSILADEKSFAVETVAPKNGLADLIFNMKEQGATDFLVSKTEAIF